MKLIKEQEKQQEWALEALKYQVGEIVRIKISGDTGQILRRFPNTKIYVVRVAGPIQHNRDGVLSKDTCLKLYDEIYFREYELEKYDKRQLKNISVK